MHRLAKRLVATGLSVLMILSLAACGKTSTDKATTSYGQIWSAPSTVKIVQYETDYEDKGVTALTYQAVRNEYENCQLIITAEKEISHFELQTTDLKNGKETLDAENVTVYVQKYVTYSDSTGTGSMPDALIPMAQADKYEENTIKAGANGALWVTIYIPKETVSGIYEGTFQLILESGKKTEHVAIPVSVEVADYTLTDEVTADTLFSWRYNRVAAGELDGSIEMMEYYYEFFRDYRISLQSLPLETLSGKEMVENVLKYYDQISTYTILQDVGSISGSLINYEEEVKEQILALAEASTVDKNLFDKAMIYCIDEPKFEDTTKRKEVVRKLQTLNAILQKCVDTIKEDTSGSYDAFKQIENWEKSILDIPSVIPILNASVEWMLANEHTEDGQELLNVVNCLCPIFGLFNDQMSEQMISLFERYDIKLWWYGCVSAVVPEPTYFIGDKNLLSARSVSWLQNKFDVIGNLYWDAAAYTDENDEYRDEYINVYKTPVRISKSSLPSGDGFLTYPGAAYGVYGPLPSLRLMSIRDGMEEYEILRDIETTLEEMSVDFGADFDTDTAMNGFYSALAYDGIKINNDGENGLDFEALRSQLIQMASGLNKGLGFAMGDVDTKGTSATFFYYIQEGATVTVNGEEQQPVSGLKYQYTMDLEKATDVEVTITNGEGETASYKQFIALPVYELNGLSDESVLSGIELTENSKAEFVVDSGKSTDGTAVHLNIQGVSTGNSLVDTTFVPAASVKTSLFGDIKLSEISAIDMDVFNPGETFHMKIRLYSGTAYMDCGDFEVKSGMNTLTLNMKNQKFSQLDTVDRIAFEFTNMTDGKLMSYEFYLDNIVAEK